MSGFVRTVNLPACVTREFRTSPKVSQVLQAAALVSSLTLSLLVYFFCIIYTLPRIFASCCILRFTGYVVATWLVLGVWIHFFLMLLRKTEVPDSLKIPFSTVPSPFLDTLLNSKANYSRDYNARVNPLDRITKNECTWRPCLACEAFVPRRSWHCQQCKKCSLRRDHHCVIARTCIGERNHVNFLGYLFYVATGTFCAGVSAVVLVFMQEGSECWPIFFKSGSIWMLIFYASEFSIYKYAIVTTLCASALLFFMLSRYLRMALKNQTSYEQKMDRRGQPSCTLAHLNEFIGPNPIWAIIIPLWTSPYQAQYDTQQTFSDLLNEIGKASHN